METVSCTFLLKVCYLNELVLSGRRFLNRKCHFGPIIFDHSYEESVSSKLLWEIFLIFKCIILVFFFSFMIAFLVFYCIVFWFCFY